MHGGEGRPVLYIRSTVAASLRSPLQLGLGLQAAGCRLQAGALQLGGAGANTSTLIKSRVFIECPNWVSSLEIPKEGLICPCFRCHFLFFLGSLRFLCAAFPLGRVPPTHTPLLPPTGRTPPPGPLNSFSWVAAEKALVANGHSHRANLRPKEREK